MTQNPAGTATTDAEAPWRRLAPGMLLVEPAREIIRFIPMLVVLLFAGHAGNSGSPWGLIGTAAVIALGISRYLTTRYRITPTVVEVRRGVFQRKHLTVPRNRVRTVDVSAHPLQRILGLVKVQIGTGTAHVRTEALALDAELERLIKPEYAKRQLAQTLRIAPDDLELDSELPSNIPSEDQIEGAKSRFTLIVNLARRERLTVRQLIGRLGGGRGHRTFAGTPEQVADAIQNWWENGAADGFNIMPPVLPSGLAIFVDQVVPILQRRGLFRTDYEGKTLRDNYGLRRPPNANVAEKSFEGAA